MLRWGIVLGLALTALTSQASAATWITMNGDSSDFITRGQSSVFTPSNAGINVSGDAGDVKISIQPPGDGGTWWDFEFAAPQGQTLHRGVYDRAQRAPFRQAGRPGIELSGSGRGCEPGGRFEVKDIASAGGPVTRLWIIWEQHCGVDGLSGSFGEVKIGEPDAAVGSIPSVVRWESGDTGVAAPDVPVTIHATAAATVSAASLDGRDAGDFRIRSDGCAGQSLPASGACTVAVGFPRTRPGTRDATLHVPTSSGAVDVPLQGFVYGGVTKFAMHSEQGDFIGQGGNYSYSLSTAFLGANGTAQHVGFSSVIPNGGDWWYADLSPAPGGALARGTYAGAQRDGYAGSNPGLDVQGNGRGCNAINGTFTISDIGFYPDDGQLRRVGATFEQHCEGSAPALRGELAFRAGDTTPPAPWMPGGSAADPQAAPPAAAKAPVCLRTAGAHAHVIGGTSRPDRIRGTRRADAIEGRAGPDRIWGGRGADCIEGGAGRDRISAGAGRDRVYAGSGNDVINGGPGRDAIDCGRGRDVAHVGRGDRTRHCERIVRNG